jgi:hypothetical protein
VAGRDRCYPETGRRGRRTWILLWAKFLPPVRQKKIRLDANSMSVTARDMVLLHTVERIASTESCQKRRRSEVSAS